MKISTEYDYANNNSPESIYPNFGWNKQLYPNMKSLIWRSASEHSAFAIFRLHVGPAADAAEDILGSIGPFLSQVTNGIE